MQSAPLCKKNTAKFHCYMVCLVCKTYMDVVWKIFTICVLSECYLKKVLIEQGSIDRFIGLERLNTHLYVSKCPSLQVSS